MDRAQESIWDKVLDGDLKAVDAFLKISARRAKINGLDQPMTIEMSLHIGQEMEAALLMLEQTVMGTGGALDEVAMCQVDLPPIEAADDRAGFEDLETPEADPEPEPVVIEGSASEGRPEPG